MILSSVYNEDMTEGDIEESGIRLANEVSNYIRENCPGDSMGQISFIGHSLGGLIIRASLVYLEEYSFKFEQFMSLSTPHLGFGQNSSKLVGAGIWVIKKWKKVKSLQQMTMSDSKEKTETFMYNLSTRVGLNWFKILTFVGSY